MAINPKTVGVIGAGRIGQAMARIARRAGREVRIANSHGPQSLTSVVAELGDGVSAGMVEEVAQAGIVVLAVMWPDVIFLSGDDADAKSEVGRLFEDAGFFIIDLGGLRDGGRMQQFRGPLAGVDLIRLPDAG
jgi:8-hydroxy-5-deazaflavin:NADPH oxidoreductase